MAYRNASTAKEILQLKREIEALRESLKPPKTWIEVIVEPDEDKSAEIAELEAKGFRVLANQILEPEPASEELPQEYVSMADATARQRELEAEEFARRQFQPRRITKLIEPSEKPFALNYPKQGF